MHFVKIVCNHFIWLACFERIVDLLNRSCWHRLYLMNHSFFCLSQISSIYLYALLKYSFLKLQGFFLLSLLIFFLSFSVFSFLLCRNTDYEWEGSDCSWFDLFYWALMLMVFNKIQITASLIFSLLGNHWMG